MGGDGSNVDARYFWRRWGRGADDVIGGICGAGGYLWRHARYCGAVDGICGAMESICGVRGYLWRGGRYF